MRMIRYTYPNTRSPWSGLESEIDRLFETALGDGRTAAPGQVPVDLYEDKDNTYLRAELPGVQRDAIQIELVNGYLSINANRIQKDGDREQTVSFTRSISVPDQTVQSDKISAAYENGVLTVTLPKREEAKPRKISVAVN